MEYKATLDRSSKLITGFITLLFLGILAYNIWLINLESGDLNPSGASIFSCTLIIAIYLFCYLFGPTKYIIERGKLIIRRPLKDLTIDILNIKDVALIDKDAMKWSIRTFGNGGLFGFYGKFRNGAFGNMTWYATKRNNYVMLKTTDSETIILTPDDTKMVDELRKLIGR
jgi:hypothetical protein